MTAKEMFEELEYSQFVGTEEEYENPFIMYEGFDGWKDTYIKFDINSKRIDCSFFDEQFPYAINMQEFKAIQKQVEELGWYEEKE